MKPNLLPFNEVDFVNYKNEPHTLKLFDHVSLMVEHEHASLINSFALRLCGDKENGTYVEIGSSHWLNDNHTYMLEKEFGWTGVGLEIESHYVDEYNKKRVNPCVLGDATTFIWDKYFEEHNFPKQIDHLSIDTDRANLKSLLNLPLSRYRFSTIVVENKEEGNEFQDINGNVQKTQKEVLSRYGYTLIGSGYTDDFWIDNSFLELQGTQWQALSGAFWNRQITN